MKVIVGIALLAALGGVCSKPFSPFLRFPNPSNNVETQQNANPLSAILQIASCVFSSSGSEMTFDRILPAIMACVYTMETPLLPSKEKAAIEEALNDLLNEEIVQELEEQQVAEMEDNSQEEVANEQRKKDFKNFLKDVGKMILREGANRIG